MIPSLVGRPGCDDRRTGPGSTSGTRPDVPGRIPGASVGFIGLSERAALAGGHLEHGLTEAGAFRLRAWLAWQA